MSSLDQISQQERFPAAIESQVKNFNIKNYRPSPLNRLISSDEEEDIDSANDSERSF